MFIGDVYTNVWKLHWVHSTIRDASKSCAKQAIFTKFRFQWPLNYSNSHILMNLLQKPQNVPNKVLWNCMGYEIETRIYIRSRKFVRIFVRMCVSYSTIANERVKRLNWCWTRWYDFIKQLCCSVPKQTAFSLTHTQNQTNVLKAKKSTRCT